MTKTLNINGRLLDLSTPAVMGILNVTPDSFYSASRKRTEKEIDERIGRILREGGSIIDVGGYSSRPDAADIPADEEMARLRPALELLQRHYPGVPVSVDTFRAGVARTCVEEYGVGIINDISGGEMDAEMTDTVAALQVPYILMHMKGTPQTMTKQTGYRDMISEMMLYFSQKVRELHLKGVADVIIDPGFGFSKTLEQNYFLMNKLSEFTLFGLPLLVGISRKRMIYRLLGGTPEESLNGTTALHTVALQQGADILRVHDVQAAVEAVKIVTELKKNSDLCGCISE